MRTQMKLGIIGAAPVVLGVTMALTSGKVTAGEPVTQPMSEIVSAETTLPSVGHRPLLKKFDVFTKKNGVNYKISAKKKLSGGSRLFVTTTIEDPDFDPIVPELTCRVFKIDESGQESALSDEVSCTGGPDSSIPITITSDMMGQQLAVEVYASTDVAAAEQLGYTPTPEKSLVHRMLSSTIVPLQLASVLTGSTTYKPDRKDPSNLQDDEVKIESAFTNATFQISMEGGSSGFVFKARDNNASFVSITGDTAIVKFTDNLRNMPNNELVFDVSDDAGNTSTFSIIPRRFYYHPENPYNQKSFTQAKALCESYSHQLADRLNEMKIRWINPSDHLPAANKGELYFNGVNEYNPNEYDFTSLTEKGAHGSSGDMTRLFHVLCEK